MLFLTDQADKFDRDLWRPVHITGFCRTIKNEFGIIVDVNGISLRCLPENLIWGNIDD